MLKLKRQITITLVAFDQSISTHSIKKGTVLISFLNKIKFMEFIKKDQISKPGTTEYKSNYIIAAKVNNQYTDLYEKITQNSIIELIQIKDKFGLQTYRNTSILLLTYAIKKVFKKDLLNIGPSIKFHYYFDLHKINTVKSSTLKKIHKEFERITSLNLPITPILWSKHKAVKYFEEKKELRKAQQIKKLSQKKVKLYQIENFIDLCDGPLAISSGIISQFKFTPYKPGFLLELPQVKNEKIALTKNIQANKISRIFFESREWYKTQQVSDVTYLNDIIRQKKLSELINISEAFHAKGISLIADKITKKKKNIKVILIAGPSSSGKTTFVQRLSIQLKVNGIRPVSISLDNYFINKNKTPKDDYGDYNFECLEALDIKLFNKNLNDLLKGKMVQLPKYNFQTGRRNKKTEPMQLLPNQIVLIEGIHGLNEKLTYAIPKKNKFKIYISSVSQLRINSNFRIATRDTRLIRRIVRDFNFRDNSALDTLRMWPSVRKGEESYIFPFQEEADIMFNSSLVYETAILKPMAEKYLKKVGQKNKEYAVAQRLLKLLDFFESAESTYIPSTSLIREFIGGSSFNY